MTVDSCRAMRLLCLVLVRLSLVMSASENKTATTCRYKKGEWSECNTLLMVNYNFAMSSLATLNSE